MSGGAKIPFNIIDTALSSLKNSQSFINSGMDIATKTALDLVESFNDEEDVNSMEKVMLEFAAMDRSLNNYIRAFEETVNQMKSGTTVEILLNSVSGEPGPSVGSAQSCPIS